MDIILKAISINANQLKLIAIITMVIDHCAVVFLPDDFPGMLALRMIGRLTAPIMCFFIAEGYFHTSNLHKYMTRLMLIALVAHIPHNLCLSQNVWRFWEATDVMFALLFGLIALSAYKSERFTMWQKLLIVFVCCLLAYSADWNYIAVLWILGFGIFHGDIRKQLISFSAVGGLYLLQAFIYQGDLSILRRSGVFFAIPFLLLYNGEKGRKNNLIKWGFYWFYPLHLLVIFLIHQFI